MESTDSDQFLTGEVRYNPENPRLFGRFEVIVWDGDGFIQDLSFAFTKRGAIRKLHRKMDAMTRYFFLESL